MTPDAYSNLQILNVTNSDLCSGSGGSNQGFFNAYQMSSWFGFPNAPAPVAPALGSASYTLQFERGVGDQTDGADMQINVGAGNDGASNVVWLQARSASNSAHYIQAVVQNPSLPGAGPFAVVVNEAGTWPVRHSQEEAAQLKWYCGPQTIPLGAPDTAQCLAIVDLRAVFGAEAAPIIADAIAQGQPSQWDAYTYWDTVQNFLSQ